MHQTVTRHVPSPAAFQLRVVVRAKLHFHLLKFLGANTLLLQLANCFVEYGEGLVGAELRLVQDACDHLRWAVVVEDVAHRIVDAARSIHRHLLLQDQPAVHASGAAAVQRLVEHCRGVPVGSAAPRRSSLCGGSLTSAGFGGGPEGMSWKYRSASAKPSSGWTSPRISSTALDGA